jgi:hypothetical protein
MSQNYDGLSYMYYNDRIEKLRQQMKFVTLNYQMLLWKVNVLHLLIRMDLLQIIKRWII